MESRLLTIRLIRLAMAVSLVLPCLLFALASWTSYRNIHALADERVARSLDVQQEEATKTFDALAEGVSFVSAPMPAETEITGPSALKLFVSSSTTDADIFAVLRVFSADMKEIVFMGAIDPHTPIGQGWLRARRSELRR